VPLTAAVTNKVISERAYGSLMESHSLSLFPYLLRDSNLSAAGKLMASFYCLFTASLSQLPYEQVIFKNGHTQFKEHRAAAELTE